MTNDNVELLLASRNDAKAAGHMYYYGKSCVYGHEGKRYSSCGACTTCQQLRNAGLAPEGGWKQPRGPVTLEFIRANCVEDPESGCWIWQRGTDGNGYGRACHQGVMERTHRLAFELSGNTIPEGLHVLHSCDRPLCCNSSHLSAGTHLDNMADMKAKGRAPNSRGEANPNAILTEDQVVKIREMLSRKTAVEIAAEFGVTRDAITNVKLGRTWRHVPNTSTAPQPTA